MSKKIINNSSTVKLLDYILSDSIEASNTINAICSNYEMAKNRIYIEKEWLKYLINAVHHPILNQAYKYIESDKESDIILSIYDNFSEEEFKNIEELLKSQGMCQQEYGSDSLVVIENYLREKIEKSNLPELSSFVGICLSPEFVESAAFSMMIEKILKDVWIGYAKELISSISNSFKKCEDVPVLIRDKDYPSTIKVEAAKYISSMNEILTSLESTKPTFNPIDDFSLFQIIFLHEDSDFGMPTPVISNDSENINDMLKTFIESFDNFEYNKYDNNCTYIINVIDGIISFCNVMKKLNITISSAFYPNTKNEVSSNITTISDTAYYNLDLIKHSLNPSLTFSLNDRFENKELFCTHIANSIKAMLTLKFFVSSVSNNSPKHTIKFDNNNLDLLIKPIYTILKIYGKEEALIKLDNLKRHGNVTKEILHEIITTNSENIPDNYLKFLLELTPTNYALSGSKVITDSM